MVFHLCIAIITHLIRINALKMLYDLSFHCFLPYKSVNNVVQRGGNIADHSQVFSWSPLASHVCNPYFQQSSMASKWVVVCKINYACNFDFKTLNAVLDVIFENAGSDFQSFLAPTASVKRQWVVLPRLHVWLKTWDEIMREKIWNGYLSIPLLEQ